MPFAKLGKLAAVGKVSLLAVAYTDRQGANQRRIAMVAGDRVFLFTNQNMEKAHRAPDWLEQQIVDADAELDAPASSEELPEFTAKPPEKKRAPKMPKVKGMTPAKGRKRGPRPSSTNRRAGAGQV